MALKKICFILFTLLVMEYSETCLISYDDSFMQQCILTCANYIDNNEIQLFYDRYGYRTSKCKQGNDIYIKELIYKPETITSQTTIPLTRGQYTESILNAIYRLNISNNQYASTPTIKSMRNLQLLNISRNFLTTAVLSNANELGMLTAIDLSYNTIYDIQLNNDQRIYHKLEKIDMSHNSLEEIPEAIFESFDNLQTLNLSYNRLKMLSPVTFEGVRQLTELNLSNNRIKSISTSLFRFSELRILDLSFNLITSLQSNDFEHLGKLHTLDLSFNMLKVIEVNAFKMITSLETLDLRNNLLEIIDVETFYYSQSLSSIDLSNNEIKSVPINLFKNSNIFSFSVTANRLEGSLIRGMFGGLNVTELDLSNQFLTEVKDYAFDDLYELRKLFLNLNSIKYLSIKCFKTLINLDHLDLSNNKITSIDFDKKDLGNLKSLIIKNNLVTEIKYKDLENLSNLEFLDLSENRICHLTPNLFQSLNNVLNLDIRSNPFVGTLETGTFNGLILLPSLDISHTMISSIRNASFTNMRELKEVNMSYCEINELQYNAFIQTGSIEKLDLSYNRLRDFSINSTEFSMLSTLLLNNNLIKTISSFSLGGNSRLNRITLSHNILENISDDTFQSLLSLSYLDLSYNEKFNFTASMLKHNKKLNTLILSGLRSAISFENFMNTSQITDLVISNASISNISHLSLGKLVNLISLDLSCNNVSKLQLGDFDNFYNLKLLQLSFNRISLIQPGIFKHNALLVSLNISHNYLPSISYGIFRGLDSLNILDVSYNKITDLQNERFYEIKHLTQLIADFNQIDSINFEEFDGTSLSKLSIGNNPLPCQMLVKLNSLKTSFEITALLPDEHRNENVNGIVCNKGRTTVPILVHDKNSKHDDVLENLRNILESVRTSNRNTEQDVSDNKYIEKISNTLDKISQVLTDNNSTNFMLSHHISNTLDKLPQVRTDNNSINFMLSHHISNTLDKLSQFLIDNNSTNVMLSKIIKSLEQTTVATTVITTSERPVTAVTHVTPRTAVIKGNSNVTPAIDIISYVSHVKEDLENAIMAKQNIINQIERKLASISNQKESIPTNFDHGKLLSNNNENKTSLFTETYVALVLSLTLLFMFIGFVLYRLYKYRIRRSFSISNHVLPGAMDSSSL